METPGKYKNRNKDPSIEADVKPLKQNSNPSFADVFEIITRITKNCDMKTLTIKALILLIFALSGCAEDEEFPYNQLIGRWEVIHIGGIIPSSFFSPVIEGRSRANAKMHVGRINWQYIFEADGTWSSVMEIHGDVSRSSRLTFFDETIKFSGIYTVDEYDDEQHSWYLTLTGTNAYTSSDLIKKSDVLPYLPFPPLGSFSGRFWARLSGIRVRPRLVISGVSLSRPY